MRGLRYPVAAGLLPAPGATPRPQDPIPEHAATLPAKVLKKIRWDLTFPFLVVFLIPFSYRLVGCDGTEL